MKKYRTIYEKIYEKSRRPGVKPAGDYKALVPGLILGHDPLVAIMIDDFEKNGFKINPAVKDICFFTADHFAPPASAERANILKKFLDFSFGNDIKNLKIFEGICHQLMVENESLAPFSYVIGSDSHTCTAGALACLASGYGSMDIMHAMVEGHIFEKKFSAAKVDFKGKMPDYIDGRDIALALIKKTGEGGAGDTALEYFDNSGALEMDDRFSIACATVETGAAAGIFAADNILIDYILKRSGRKKIKFGVAEIEKYYGDISFEYEKTLRFDLSRINPLVAIPHDFSKIYEVESLKKDVMLDQVFIGSCASGRLLDFKRMCETIDRINSKKKTAGGARRNKKTRLIITPASQKIFIEAMKAGYIEKLINFGAVITNPSCGPCGGIDKGIIGGGEICLTTATRNFRGRMGPLDSSVYIASAVTAIYSAYAGIVADPREIYGRKVN